MSTKSVAQVLAGAADLIEEYGHCKGEFRSMDGRFCAYGAMRVAAGVATDGGKSVDWCSDGWVALTQARLQLQAVVKEAKVGMAPWNDHRDRTKEEVIAALRAAAEAAA